MINLFVFASALLIAPLAFAGKVTATPTGMQVFYNGDEAKNLFEALKPYAKVSAEPEGGDTVDMIYLANLEVTTFWNTALNETDPCFKQPSYLIKFVDMQNRERTIKIDESKNCNADKPAAIVKALKAIEADDFSEVSMGRANFSVPHLTLSHDPEETGDSQYTLIGTLGSDVYSGTCK